MWDMRCAAAFILGLLPGIAGAQTAPVDARNELAPGGVLRAAINYGNPVLAQRIAGDSLPRGVSADLARELARRLGVPIAYVEFDAAGAAFEALKKGQWDVGFLAIDPKRAEEIAFSPPYVVIEGAYLVRVDSRFRTNDDVDRTGVRIAVGRGSAYDLFLTRELRQAQLVRAQTSAAAIDMFVNEGLDVCAGVRQPLDAFVRTRPDMRLLPGAFMAINQAVAKPKSRSAAARYLRTFIEEMKSSGFVARSLASSGQTAGAVAPPAPNL